VGSPASSVVLTPLTKELAGLVGSWFAADEEGRRRLDAGFYGSDLRWWALVQRSGVRHGWVGLLGDERVGFIDVEVDGERGGVAIYVRHEFRRHRIGQQLLRLAAAEGRSLGVAELVGNVQGDNVASIRCFVAAGFSQAGVDKLGPVFRLRLADASLPISRHVVMCWRSAGRRAPAAGNLSASGHLPGQGMPPARCARRRIQRAPRNICQVEPLDDLLGR
jgi:GNAT superfamily N-acetyltransferase